jgi:hypothetical protein
MTLPLTLESALSDESEARRPEDQYGQSCRGTDPLRGVAKARDGAL